ncbi:MAG: hypothetical protein SGCHY_005614 [Lobulomycetales sp.]
MKGLHKVLCKNGSTAWTLLPKTFSPSSPAVFALTPGKSPLQESHVNPLFEDFLHRTLCSHIHSDPSWAAMARQQSSGFLNIADHRVFVPYGRVPDPEDILGTVRLEAGEIVPESYERFPAHRMITPLNGPTQLTDHMHAILLEQLKMG